MITGCQLEYWIIMQKMNAAQQEVQFKDIHCQCRRSIFWTLSRRIHLKVEAFDLISQFVKCKGLKDEKEDSENCWMGSSSKKSAFIEILKVASIGLLTPTPFLDRFISKLKWSKKEMSRERNLWKAVLLTETLSVWHYLAGQGHMFSKLWFVSALKYFFLISKGFFSDIFFCILICAASVW